MDRKKPLLTVFRKYFPFFKPKDAPYPPVERDPRVEGKGPAAGR